MSQDPRDGEDFVPGELLIGVASPEDCGPLLRQLERNSYRPGGDRLAGVKAATTGGSTLKLKVAFSDTTRKRLREAPGSELALLEELARQIKAENACVRYAHPNWIARLDPIERMP